MGRQDPVCVAAQSSGPARCNSERNRQRGFRRGETDLDESFVYLTIEGAVLKRLSSMGYRTSVVPKSRFKGMPADVATVDFSGWPMVVRADMPDDVAFALCEAIESRKHLIPTDNFNPPDIAQRCANGEEAPYNIPLPPGARRFYRERGYLN